VGRATKTHKVPDTLSELRNSPKPNPAPIRWPKKFAAKQGNAGQSRFSFASWPVRINNPRTFKKPLQVKVTWD
jgi:hypothetical protein